MLTDDIQQAMYAAMKAHQSEEVSALRLALSALKTAAIEAPDDLSVDEVVTVLQREARKHQESEQVFREAGRGARADQEAFALRILGRFLPAAIEPGELAQLVDDAIAATGASDPRELGKVMGRVMPAVKGRADGNEVRKLALERLQASGAG